MMPAVPQEHDPSARGSGASWVPMTAATPRRQAARIKAHHRLGGWRESQRPDRSSAEPKAAGLAQPRARAIANPLALAADSWSGKLRRPVGQARALSAAASPDGLRPCPAETPFEAPAGARGSPAR